MVQQLYFEVMIFREVGVARLEYNTYFFVGHQIVGIVIDQGFLCKGYACCE